jgi:hypothetical protein
MTVSLSVTSKNDQLLRLVHDFALGLGCAADWASTSVNRSVQIQVDDDHNVLELLTHVALSATKAGVDVSEPICQMTYQYSGAISNVTLALRLADVRIDPSQRPGT